jgi:hypothetical protein
MMGVVVVIHCVVVLTDLAIIMCFVVLSSNHYIHLTTWLAGWTLAGVPNAATCEALNEPGSPQRFFWTPGCASCAGREVCGAALDPSLPRWFLDDRAFDFRPACEQK